MSYKVEILEDSFTISQESTQIVIGTELGSTSVDIVNETLEIIDLDDSQIIIFEDPELEVIESYTQGPTGAQGPKGDTGADGLGTFSGIIGPIAAAGSQTVDTVSASLIRAVKWLVSIQDLTAGLYRSYEVTAHHDGTTVNYSPSAILGDQILHTFDVQLSGADLNLVITNTSGNELYVTFSRWWTATA